MKIEDEDVDIIWAQVVAWRKISLAAYLITSRTEEWTAEQLYGLVLEEKARIESLVDQNPRWKKWKEAQMIRLQ